MCGKKAAYIAYVRVAGKDSLGQRLVGGHVRELGDQDEIRPAGDPIALRDFGCGDDVSLEGLQPFNCLRIQGDFDNGGQPGAQVLWAQDGDLSLDDAALGETAYPPQAGGGRGVDALGEGLVGESAILLELIQDAAIQVIEFDFGVCGHKYAKYWAQDVIYMKYNSI